MKVGKDIIGAAIKAKVVKNKMGPPQRETVFNMYYDKGIIQEEAWLSYLLDYGIAKPISKQKSSIDFEGTPVEFKNREFALALTVNPELKKFCITEIKKRLRVEQDPTKREEDIVLEPLSPGEEV